MKLKNGMINWLARRLPTCKEVTRMASDAMEHRMPWRRRVEYKLHLMICSWCLRYVRQLQAMREISHQHDAKAETGVAKPSTRLSNDARERMKRALQA